jgi:C-terminal processing protease CtpA/Prc
MSSLDLIRRPGFPIFVLATLFTWPTSEGLNSGDSQPSSATSKPAIAAAGAGAPDPVPPEKLREDFRILRGALEEGHPGIYRYTTKQVLDREFDQAETALDHPMNVYEFYRIVAPVVAAIKCGHTGVRVPPDLAKGKPNLPLAVRVLDGKVYVLRDLSDAKGALAGAEIRAVNGMATDKIVQTMLAAMPADGDVQTARMRRIGGSNFAAALIDLLGLESPYTITLRDAKQGPDRAVRLEGIDAAKLAEQRPKESATLTFFDDGKIADLKIHRFGGTANKKELKVFFQECFTELAGRKSTALILDLRDNGGGADDLGKLLLSYLIDEPFQYYDDLVLNGLDFSFRKHTTQKRALPSNMLERQPNGKYRMVKHPNWGTQQPSKPSFTGKVYILINGNSFSTTSEFLSHAHARKRAEFIGEESGGGYYGNTSGPGALLSLPNTKLQAYVPLMTYYMAVRDYKAASHGVVPDHPVKYTIDELLAGSDKELALALELARKNAR